MGEQAKDGPDWAFRNSGVMIHGQPAETMGKDQDFPISIEVQLLGGRGDGKPRPTANLCTPGTNVVMDGQAHYGPLRQLHVEDLRRRSVGARRGRGPRRRRHHAHGQRRDGARVREAAARRRQRREPRSGGEEGRQAAREGSISLQSESHPVEFRKVELLNLVGCRDKKAKNYRRYFEKSDPAACR